MLAALVALGGATALRAAHLTVYAAASLGDVLGEIAEAWTDRTGGELTLVLAGSSAIARQIQAGAPAGLVILANPDWMDVLDAAGVIDAASRTDLLGNRLVLIGAPGQAPLDLSDPEALPTRLDEGRLALALTEAVPAGIYARAALNSLGLWAAVAPRVVEADNVRAALALVALGAADFGIVYATDAEAEPRVTVLAEIPADTHPPIIYPAALVAGGETTGATALLAFLTTPVARAVFESHGFSPLTGR
jgi:molybdate transport system substrate-binding protein